MISWSELSTRGTCVILLQRLTSRSADSIVATKLLFGDGHYPCLHLTFITPTRQSLVSTLDIPINAAPPQSTSIKILHISSGRIPLFPRQDGPHCWQRAITSYLVRKGAHKTLEGTEVEPFRTPGAYLPGTRAGNHQPDATQSTTGAVFTAAQRLLWAEWSIREHEARLTVILTVSHGIRAEIECMWSANDMNRHISSTHKVDTTSHQADLSARISPLRLPLKASREKMLEHYKSCSFLSAEAVSFGCTHRRLGEV